MVVELLNSFSAQRPSVTFLNSLLVSLNNFLVGCISPLLYLFQLLIQSLLALERSSRRFCFSFQVQAIHLIFQLLFHQKLYTLFSREWYFLKPFLIELVSISSRRVWAVGSISRRSKRLLESWCQYRLLLCFWWPWLFLLVRSKKIIAGFSFRIMLS